MPEPSDRWKQLYCDAMTEIHMRQDVIQRIVDRRVKLPIRPAYELCHLEMRMICELIALSSLAVHGELPGTRSSRLQSAYRADMILKALEKMHPAFFPNPATARENSDGTITITDQDRDAFSKSDIIELYNQVDDVLHRGRFKDWGFLELKADAIDAISDWPIKIRNLLECHTIIGGHPNAYELLWIQIGPDHRTRIDFLKRIDDPLAKMD